jgi:hypothetical protein
MFEFFRKAAPEKKNASPLIALSLQGGARWAGAIPRRWRGWG